MSAADLMKQAFDELKTETARSIQQHKDDAKALADMTTKLNAGLNGDPNVDIAAIAQQIHQSAQDLAQGLTSAHTDAVAPKTANAGTSVVQGGSTTGPDVVSASSPGVIVPPPSGTEASNDVPSSLGGGAMPATSATDGSTSEKEPGEPVPSTKEGEDPKPAEPAVPSVEDVPSNLTDTQPEGTKKD